MKQHSAILVFDAGNTAVTYAFYFGGRVHRFGSASIETIEAIVRPWIRKMPSGVLHHAAISSVDPKKTKRLQSLFRRLKLKVWIAGQNLPVPIHSRYAKTLGIDRALLVHGALRIFKPPFLLIDFGTAVTFDYVSEKGVLEGGLIIPGPGIAFGALKEKTALLPKQLKFPAASKCFPGRDTKSAMNAGILEGYGAMTDGLIERFQNRFGEKMRVIATGGYAEILQSFSKKIGLTEPRLAVNTLLLLTKKASR